MIVVRDTNANHQQESVSNPDGHRQYEWAAQQISARDIALAVVSCAKRIWTVVLTFYQRVRDRDHLADLELDARNDLRQDRVLRGSQETLLAKLGGESTSKADFGAEW
jgi:hypothetical protein